MKIKGATTAKVVSFPEWTADELALWTDKDESACVSWRDSRATKWEGGDAKLKESYPTREELDAWLDKQCASSKNKSLYKRTRTAKKKAAAAAAGGGSAAPAPAALTATSARTLLDQALATFREPANKAQLTALVAADAAKGDAAGADGGMGRMMAMMPVIQTMLGPVLKEYGFAADELMTVATQLMGFGGADASIAADTSKLMKAAQGDLSDLFE